MKFIIYLAIFSPILLHAQQKQPVTSVQPDCVAFFNLTVASSGAQAAGTVTAGSPGTSILIDNHQVGCFGWTVAYTSHGFSAVTLHFQSAPDNTGGTAPGTWVDFAGTLIVGINPNTASTQAITTATGYYPWVRMNLTAKTGTGGVVGVLYGFKVNSAANGGIPPTTCPGGSPTELQYNLAGACAGMSGTSWTDATRSLVMVGGTGAPFTIEDPATNPVFGLAFAPASASFFSQPSSPPSVATSPGTSSGGLTGAIINGRQGGSTTIATTGLGGDGEDIVLNPGGGGGAPNAVTSSTGGKGGFLGLNGGQGAAARPGSATSIGGDSQGIIAYDGDGGPGSTANGKDGTFHIQGGVNANADILSIEDTNGTVLSDFGADGSYTNLSIAFAALGTPADGTQKGCANCKVTSGIDDTCADDSSGAVPPAVHAMAFRINGAWKCQQ